MQRGDRVLAWAAGGPAHIQHEGFVHQVEGGALVILFSKGFKGAALLPTRLQMRFAVDRLAMRPMARRRRHAAFRCVAEPPVLTTAADADDAAAIAAAASALVVERLNDSQRSVVARLLRRTVGGAPFLLFGPFGTGRRALRGVWKQPLAAAPAAAAPAAAAAALAKGGKAGGKGKPPAKRRMASRAAARARAAGLRVLICSPSNSSADAWPR